MRVLGWLGLYGYAKYKSCRNHIANTMTPFRTSVHCCCFSFAIVIVLMVSLGWISDSSQNWLEQFQRESALFYFRVFGWMKTGIEITAYILHYFIPISILKNIFQPLLLGYILTGFLLPIVIFYGLILLLPQWIVWSVWQKRFYEIAGMMLLLYSMVYMIHFHAGYCRWGYDSILQRKSESIPVHELYRQCGKPVYWSLMKRNEEEIYWEGLYTNGLSEVRVVLKKDDTATIAGITGLWLD